MKTALDITLIAGFLLVDFLFFHDIFKAGEVITAAQYLTGVLSVMVIARSAFAVLKGESHA